jgi:exosortase/archaeosortase family protein
MYERKRDKKFRFLIHILLLAIFAYAIVFLVILDFDPIGLSLNWVSRLYLCLSEYIANLFLFLWGSPVRLNSIEITANNVVLQGFIPQVRFGNWMIILVTLIWLVRTSVKDRIVISFFLIFTHLIIISVNLVIGSHFIAYKGFSYHILAIQSTLGLIILITFWYLWFRIRRVAFLERFSNLGIPIRTPHFETELHILLVVYVFVITIYFLKEMFEFRIWIEVLFTSSQKILNFFGYESVVESNKLIGKNGFIYMNEDCLGIATMYLFSVLIFLTKGSTKAKVIYVLTGIFLLNLVNILRFVMLFIYIQKNRDYELSVDVHNMYNYAIYILVFLLWIVWFEKFANESTVHDLSATGPPHLKKASDFKDQN